MPTSDTVLQSIDTKLAALLALVLDAHIRQSGIAKPKERSIDVMLTDAGLTPQQIAGLLGKTDRAVTLQLQRERESPKKRKTVRKVKSDGG